MKLSNSKLLALAIGIVGLVWCVGIVTVSYRMIPPFHYVGALVFGLITICASILYLLMLHRPSNRQAVEVGVISLWATVVYVVAVLWANTYFVVHWYGDFNRFLLLTNIAINAVYVIVVLFAEKDAQRLNDQLERADEKLSASIDISARLGEILGVVEDDALRAQVRTLKEAVDYSTNITTADTYKNELVMVSQLEELLDLIVRKSDSDAIQSKLREAEHTWKTRSSNAASRR